MLNSAIIHWVFRYASGVVPTVAISNVTSISYTSATVTGNVTAAGSSAVTERGICYGTSYDPTITGTKAISGSGTGSFSANLTGLTAGTTYYVRAYATNTAGTGYSTNATFTTTAISVPSVTTVSVGTITSNSAIVTGNATAENGSSITERGICWNSTGNPTIANSRSSAGPGTGSIAITIGSLSANTTYYARAYATNAAGTGYGTTLSFTTAAAVTVPTVATGTASSVTSNSADVSGNVTADGGATVTERGICYGTSANPTVSGTHVASGSGTGSFTASLTGLTASTTYYVRAYATNSAGTAYGTQASFATSAAPSSSIPFQEAMDWVNTNYPNNIKALCYNFTINTDELLYFIINPGTGSTPTYNKKRIVVFKKDESTPRLDTLVSIPSGITSAGTQVYAPWAINGFFGYYAVMSNTAKVVIFKFNSSTNTLEKVGSASTTAYVIQCGKYMRGTISCFTYNNYYHVQVTTNGTRETQDVINLNYWNSGGYWLPTRSRTEPGDYRGYSTAVAASPTSTNIVFYGQCYSASTYSSSDKQSLWKDTKCYKSRVSNTGAAVNGSVPLFVSGANGTNTTPNSYSPAASLCAMRMQPVYNPNGEDRWLLNLTSTGYHILNFTDSSNQALSYDDLLSCSGSSVKIASYSNHYTTGKSSLNTICDFFLPVSYNNGIKVWYTSSNYKTITSADLE